MVKKITLEELMQIKLSEVENIAGKIELSSEDDEKLRAELAKKRRRQCLGDIEVVRHIILDLTDTEIIMLLDCLAEAIENAPEQKRETVGDILSNNVGFFGISKKDKLKILHMKVTTAAAEASKN